MLWLLKGLSSHPFPRARPPSYPGRSATPQVRCSGEGTARPSPRGVAAQEGVEHGLLHALLVLPTPGDHRPVAVRGVQVVAIAGKREAVKANPSGALYFLKLSRLVAVI